MCGAINSGLAKATRLKIIEEEARGSTVDIMCCGSKCVNGLKKFFADRFKTNYEECQVVPFNFITASIIAEGLISADPDRASLVYNKYVSMIAYEALVQPVYTKKAAK